MSKLWDDTLSHLELNLSPQHFSTWIKPLKLVKIEQDMVYLEVPNRFVLDWVKENYSKLIQKKLSDLSAVSYRLHFDVSNQAVVEHPKTTPIVDKPVALVASKNIVNKTNSADPVAVQNIVFSLFVVLTPRKVPHKISAIHITKLKTHHKLNVLGKSWPTFAVFRNTSNCFVHFF